MEFKLWSSHKSKKLCMGFDKFPRAEGSSYALLMDEMKVKSGLVYKKNSGDLVGFIDLGSVNSDTERVIMNDVSNAEPALAEQMLAFMIRPVLKPSLSFVSF